MITVRKISKLTEADNELKSFMTKKEVLLKKKLTQLLIDDGHGHKHSKYAQVLQYFDIHIVPLDEDPQCTAYVEMDRPVIGIGESMLYNQKVFNQLSVVIRHELGHRLMKHEIRMAAKLGNKLYNEHFKYSPSIHNLLNIIMDDELSNTRYSAEDKDTIRHLWVNGQIISGLVTEDHRQEWLNMSLEQMWDAMNKEAEDDNAKLNMVIENNLMGGQATPRDVVNVRDYITGNLVQASDYKSKCFAPSHIYNLDSFLNSDKLKKYPKPMQDLAHNIVNELSDKSQQDLVNLVIKISKSKFDEEVKLTNDILLYTPEEKLFAAQLINTLLGNIDQAVMNKYKPKLTVSRQNHDPEYVATYNRTLQDYDKKSVESYTITEIADALAEIIDKNGEQDVTGIIDNKDEQGENK